CGDRNLWMVSSMVGGRSKRRASPRRPRPRGDGTQLDYRRVMLAQRWYVLGFTADAVVGAWQDARLAQACMRAWEAAGRPAPFAILQAPGDGHFLVHWFIDEPTAA